jgi:hypothetical protein
MVMGKEHMVDGDVVDYDGDKIPFPRRGERTNLTLCKKL